MSTFTYTLTGATGTFCGENLSIGDILSVQWSVVGDAGYDQCYVAVRPLSDLVDDGAIVAGNLKVPCGQGSASFSIPSQPINSSFPFNGDGFATVINAQNGYHTNTCAFQLYNHYSAPWERADKMALAGTVTGGLALIVSIVALCKP